MFCDKCGKEIADSAQFCKYCGSKMNYHFGEPAKAYADRTMMAPAVPPVNSLTEKNSKRWPFIVIIITLVYLVFSAILGVIIIHRNYVSIPQPEWYSFGEYFGDAFGTYLLSYCLIPALFILVFALPTKKAAWITCIPLILGAVLSIFSYSFTYAHTHINVVSNLVNAVLVLVFAILYLLITVLRNRGLTVVLILLSVFRIGASILMRVLNIDQRINVGKTQFITQPIIMDLLNVVGIIVFSFIFIIAAYQVIHTKYKQNDVFINY